MYITGTQMIIETMSMFPHSFLCMSSWLRSLRSTKATVIVQKT